MLLDDYVDKLNGTSILLSVLFFGVLFTVVLPNMAMFNKKIGFYHAIVGFVYLMLLSYGFIVITNRALGYATQKEEDGYFWFYYDVLLGVSGVILPLTAAYEFKHHKVKNIASGTLDEHATVTHSEMIEHSFYQGVNLVQIVFLHVYNTWFTSSLWMQLLAVALVTSPWLIRNQFPINKFSDNYKKIDEKSTPFIRTLYRIKKHQYIFYKHFILHGLNVSVALYQLYLPTETSFRLFWLLLNTSYVMEFFLQTLVKKQYLLQTTMLRLQLILMSASSLSAVVVLGQLNLVVALLSTASNFLNRKHDFINTVAIFLLVKIYFVLL